MSIPIRTFFSIFITRILSLLRNTLTESPRLGLVSSPSKSTMNMIAHAFAYPTITPLIRARILVIASTPPCST